LADRRFVLTDTMDIILTPARLTASTDLTGLPVECLSAPAHGMAGVAVGVGVAEAGADVGSSADAGLEADAVLHAVVRASVAALVVDFMAAPHVEGSTVAAGFIAEAVSTVAEVEDSTAVEVEDSTAAAVDMAADTGKFARGLI